MDNYQEIKELVSHYMRGIWRNRWKAILIAWVVMISGLIIVDRIKDQYTAETKVYIDTSSVLRPLLKGLAVPPDYASNVQLMVRTLLSRPNLKRAIRLMDMDIDTQSELDMELLIEATKGRVSISTTQRSSIYTITYEDENSQRAKRMVQTLLDIFVEDTLGKSAKESDSAIAFLNKQIEKYDTLLEEAEQRLEKFKRDNVGVMPKDGVNYYNQLQALNKQYEQASLILTELEKRRDQLETQIDQLSLEKAVELTGSKYDESISRIEVNLENLLLNYTEAHPDVANAQRILDAMKQKRDDEINNLSTDNVASKLDNPVYQELQILLSKTEANISSLKTRVRAYEQKMSELKKFVDTVPQIESELLRLNRDYNVHKKNYNEMVSRREQAKISEDVESGTEQVKFRIIEPPRVPNIASFPNRPLLDLAVLVLSLGIGYGIGLLFSLAKPVFYNTKDLRDFSGLAVLGSVMKFDTAGVLRKRRWNIYLFIFANLVLLSVTAAVIFLHSQHIPVLTLLEQLFNRLQQYVTVLI